jgi:tetratricopeptide (TPR) repeat protein
LCPGHHLRGPRPLDEYQHAAELKPDEPLHRRAWGKALYKLGRHDEATDVLVKALALDGSDAEAHWQLGATFEAQGNYERARSEYAKAAEIAPDKARYLLRLGAIYRRLGQHAWTLWQAGIPTQTPSAEDYEKAIAALQRAISLGED